MANEVTYTRPELIEMLDSYTVIEDCISGQEAIKSKATTYLPKPNPTNLSKENESRYDAYLKRAVFYNATSRTLTGLNGQVFMREPVVSLPTQLKPMIDNVDGTISLRQLAKKTNTSVLSKGRAGLLTDFPITDGEISLKDQRSGMFNPTIVHYDARQITNWREKSFGSLRLKTMVVLKESFTDDSSSIFNQSFNTQYRVLSLSDERVYSVSLYREESREDREFEKSQSYNSPYSSKKFTLYSSSMPVDADGKPFDVIPFEFVGSEDNDSNIDSPPLLDMANLNIAHYRNSADYEESAYMVGQPTPVFTGMTDYWVKEVLGDKVHLGSRTSIPLPVGAAASLLQASPNSMPKEAMDQKEKQMVALGAKLIEPSSVARTATEATIEKSAENSILASSARNTSSAIEQCLKWSAKFIGVDGSSIEYSLPTEFDLALLTSEEKRQLNNDWVTGAISFTEMRRVLKKTGIAVEDDDAVKEELNKMKLEASSNVAPAVGDNNNGNQ